MITQALIFSLGILLLYAGGMLFIKGSSSTAQLFHIKPIVIGVVIVALATSAPEFFVSILASVRRSQSLAMGNIIGSCICNIAMVLGIAAIIKPIKAEAPILRREIPVLFAATIILFAVSMDFYISRVEGCILLIVFLIFIYYCIRNAKTIGKNQDILSRKSSRFSAFVFLLLGLTGLLSGAYIAVDSAVTLARYLGISELVIGLTIVAIGTSLPELFASVAASKQSESDICLGNIIGSNIFNTLAIIGVVSLIQPIYIGSGVVFFSFPVLILYTMALAPIIRTGYTVSRKEGLLLVSSYFVYLWMVLAHG
jgi:cation:H+ antiporter